MELTFLPDVSRRAPGSSGSESSEAWWNGMAFFMDVAEEQAKTKPKGEQR